MNGIDVCLLNVKSMNLIYQQIFDFKETSDVVGEPYLNKVD